MVSEKTTFKERKNTKQKKTCTNEQVVKELS